MRRREFIGLVGGAAAAWPRAARAQVIPVVGFLNSGSSVELTNRVTAFRQGLKEIGFVEGQNVAIQYRWAEGQYDRLPGLAAELVSQQVAVIAATGGIVTARAAKMATTTIPILFSIGGDPVELGLVPSLNRPGGNVTGVTLISSEVSAKRMEVLSKLVPNAALIAVLSNPTNPGNESEMKAAQDAAAKLGRRFVALKASTAGEFEAVFATLAQQRAGALVVFTDPFFESHRIQLIALAARNSVPVIYALREYADAGGLISYGASVTDLYRRAGIYVGRIIKGEKPADLPVMQPTTFELVINLRAAKALGLTVPPTLLAGADEVIE